MTTIEQLLARDLSEPIEEVIKLEQQDEQTVYKEITEYVATDSIKNHYLKLLKAMADAPSDPTEGVGVWISGFFGSGKSSFAKILGYILANRELLGAPAAQLFIQQLQTQTPADPKVDKIKELLEYINARIPTHVIMFDVQVDRAVRRASEPLAEIMYTVLLRELDYALDYDVAELEIELEGEKRLAEFVRVCADLFRDEVGKVNSSIPVPVTIQDASPEDYAVWRKVRKGAQRIQRTSAALHAMDPKTYPQADSWAKVFLERDTDITIRTLVDRTFDLTARRRPGYAPMFIIDEVGQYVARSGDKIENLRATVEQFGVESRNRLIRGKALAPVWVIVTSQEKLDEVVAAIDDKRVELARLQDRFRIRIDMAPADIREVATKRVLSKNPQGEQILSQVYEKYAPVLGAHTHLERTHLPSEVSKEDFIQFYPYLPHYIDLSIDIVSGIRLQAGAPRHIGGSNRTIIKQAYEMLVSDRTRLKDKPVGELVTLDRIYELVEGNLPSEKQRDISRIGQHWPDDPWPARTAKAIALLEFVRTVPRTEANLAALLYRRLGDPSPLPQVEQALEALAADQFVRRTQEGWKLLTEQEKNWTSERNAFNPAPRERNDLLEAQFQAIFQDPGLTRYRYKNYRTFRVGVSWNRRNLTSGDAHIPLELFVADDLDSFDEVCQRVQQDSRLPANQNTIAWVLYLTDEIDDLVTELYRSKRMVAKYEQLRAQGKINKEEAASLSAEKQEVPRLEARLQSALENALTRGRGFFRGVSKDGANLGRTLSEIFKKLFSYAVPYLYDKLEMGAVPVKSGDPVAILKAANLTALPKVYYAPPDGLDLVIREGNRYVVNLNAPIVQEVANYLASQHSYGNRVTGRMLENHFGGLGYGWELDVIKVVLAAMLRGGAIEVTYQGRRHRNHLDPQVRTPFTGTQAFRSASFAPRKAPDLRTLVSAVRRYEELTGEEVDVEESAIAQAFKNLAREEMQALQQLEATVQANHIRGLERLLREYRDTLQTILDSASDDCVNMLAGEGASFKELRDEIHLIRRHTNEEGLGYLARLRKAYERLWPALQEEGFDSELEKEAAILQETLTLGTFYLPSPERDQALKAIESAYRKLYQERHEARHARYLQAMDDIKGRAEWTQVSPEMQEGLLAPLVKRACKEAILLKEGEDVCPHCHASLRQMASDLAAVEGLRDQVLVRLQELVTPEDEKVERVRVSQIIGAGRAVNSPEEVDEVLDALREYLLKLIDSGVHVILE